MSDKKQQELELQIMKTEHESLCQKNKRCIQELLEKLMLDIQRSDLPSE